MSSYVEESLIDGEIIQQTGHVTWWGQIGLLIWGILTIWLVIGIIFFIWAFINVRSTELAITNKKLIGKIGFIKRSSIDLPIQKIESIGVEQTLIGRLLDYGTLTIRGTGGDGLTIKHIKQPLVFRKTVMNIMDAMNNHPIHDHD